MTKLKFGLMKIEMNNHCYLFRIFLGVAAGTQPVRMPPGYFQTL
jgi:hypothetical protein